MKHGLYLVAVSLLAAALAIPARAAQEGTRRTVLAIDVLPLGLYPYSSAIGSRLYRPLVVRAHIEEAP